MTTPKTISANQSFCSKRTFKKRMKKAKMLFLLYYYTPQIFAPNYYIASNDGQYLGSLADDIEKGNPCDFRITLVERVKFKTFS